jgi:thiamine kinase-like enzyme
VIDRLNEVGMTKQQLTIEVQNLESIVESLNSPIVLCHNDVHPNNIIYNEQERKLHDQTISYSAGRQFTLSLAS